ncbi:hypothetical protein [Streptomyces sediminimaris]|uniref:hypothetical protein n=1 Tax=Streptomyces sediminimaris TaxID=3383721 RepID=UPI003999C3A8
MIFLIMLRIGLRTITHWLPFPVATRGRLLAARCARLMLSHRPPAGLLPVNRLVRTCVRWLKWWGYTFLLLFLATLAAGTSALEGRPARASRAPRRAGSDPAQHRRTASAQRVWRAAWLVWGMVLPLHASAALPVAAVPAGAFPLWWIALAAAALAVAAALPDTALASVLTLLFVVAGSGAFAFSLVSGAYETRLAAGWFLLAADATALFVAGTACLELWRGDRSTGALHGRGPYGIDDQPGGKQDAGRTSSTSALP